MIISNSKKFAMFLPWKTASQTMVARLQQFNETPYSRFFEFNRYLNRVVHQHMTCADFLGLPESKLEGYFIGSFVRNPYDRAYSGFRQLQIDIAQQRAADYYPSNWIRSLVMKQLDEIESQLRTANYEFDAWFLSVSEEQIFETGRNTNFPLHPSHYWTHIADTQFVNFVGKVESFEQDFASFCERADLAVENSSNVNVVDISGSSAASPFGYRYADRMSRRSIDKINHLFAKDFELFGYKQIRYQPFS
jgi:hypothetical protein